MGLRQRQRENAKRRAEGKEPQPGCCLGSGVKRWMRYHKRVIAKPVKIRHPEKYLNAHARRRLLNASADLSTDAKFDALRAALA